MLSASRHPSITASPDSALEEYYTTAVPVIQARSHLPFGPPETFPVGEAPDRDHETHSHPRRAATSSASASRSASSIMGVTILIAMGASFQKLRDRIDAQGKETSEQDGTSAGANG